MCNGDTSKDKDHIMPEQDLLRTDIRSAGLRATPARIAVLGLIRRTPKPVSHSEVVTAFEGQGWNRTTLFRNLNDLERAGLVRRTQLGGTSWRFEDARGRHGSRSHPHFVCTSCHKVVCLPDLEISLAKAPDCGRAIRDNRFEVQLRGNCDHCLADGGS